MKFAWVCSRCGQERTAVMEINGRLVCNECVGVRPQTKRGRRRSRGKDRAKPKRKRHGLTAFLGGIRSAQIENVPGRIP